MSFDLDSVSGFDSPFFNLGFPKTEPFDDNRAALEQKTTALFTNTVRPMEVGGSGRIEAHFEWGDGKGGHFSGGVSGEIHDDNGNFVEIKVEQKENGNNSVDVAAGHEKENG